MKNRSRYLVFTGDKQLIRRLNAVFSPRQICYKSVSDFPSLEEGNKLVLIDGDNLPWEAFRAELNVFKRKKIPVVYIFSALGGTEVMEVLNNGVIGVLFKDYPAEQVKRELKDILFNFNYLERVKEIAENDSRTKKFLGVVNSLTSDNDINTLMNNILKSMVQVFHLKSTVFFIVKRERLTYKLELGQCPRDYSTAEWALNDLNQEINNPFSIISMEAQMLQQRPEKNESKMESRLFKIEQNIERVKKILEKISALNVDNLPLTDYIGGKKMINLYEN